MSKIFKDLEKKLLKLKSKEVALLAEHQINEPDDIFGKDSEVLWLKEAEKRYESFRKDD